MPERPAGYNEVQGEGIGIIEKTRNEEKKKIRRGGMEKKNVESVEGTRKGNSNAPL